MKRFTHIAGIILAVVAFALAEISKDTHFAWAGGVIALVTNLRVALAGLGGPSVTIMALATGLAASCAHVTPVVVDCGKAVAPSILPAVETALVAADYVDELAKLVGQYGECVIRKAVEQITGEARADLGYAEADVNARRKYEHGAAWLAAHPSN
jgi:hypothetical protein